MKEIRIHKKGNMKISDAAKRDHPKNMFLEELYPIVKTTSQNDTLFFNMDTGAMKSELSYKYYTDHKNEVEKYGKKESSKRGGAGGRVDVDEYKLKDFPIKIDTTKALLSEILVSLEEYDFNKYFDGNLGQDVLGQFNTLIINFEYMYVTFDN